MGLQLNICPIDISISDDFGTDNLEVFKKSWCLSSWWFQPIWRIVVKMGILRGENTKYLKPPPRLVFHWCLLYWFCQNLLFTSSFPNNQLRKTKFITAAELLVLAMVALPCFFHTSQRVAVEKNNNPTAGTSPKIDHVRWKYHIYNGMYYIPGTLNNHFLVLVSVGWFQIVYSKNGCFNKHPLKTCCLEFHVLNEWYDIIKCGGPSDMTIWMYDLMNNLSYIMIRSRTLHLRVFQWWRWNVLRQNTCNIVQNLLQVLFQTRMITSPREKNKSKQKHFPNLRSYVADSQ